MVLASFNGYFLIER